MKIEYSASVKTDAGWRNVTISADADRVSPGFAVVTAVTAIDGNPPAYGMSRTGARRQSFSGFYVANRETGTRKRLSACSIVES